MAFVRWIPARIFTGTSGSCRRLFSQDKSGDGDDSTQVCHHLEDVSAVQPETPIAVPAKTNKAFRTSAWKVSKIFTEEVPKVEELSFATMLRRSKLMELGDPKGKTVEGVIFHTVEDDLYIDFGGKFHCVCQRPAQMPEAYIRGAKVRIILNNLELSTKFLGATKDITLKEADATLVGLVRPPQRKLPSTNNQ